MASQLPRLSDAHRVRMGLAAWHARDRGSRVEETGPGSHVWTLMTPGTENGGTPMTLTESSTQTAKVIGSITGLLLFFLAPFLAEFGFISLAAIPSRRQALSSTGTIQGSASYHPLLQYFILIGILTLLTLAGFLIWRYSWKHRGNDIPKVYFYLVIGLGSLTLIINLLWVGVKLLAGFTAAGLSSTGLSSDFGFPLQFSFLLSFAWVLEAGVYLFGHPILAFLMLRYHWHLIKR